jgi:myo-inositol 2-dehydrogenase / D-chiro-inositol 1-dehydrogenase
MADAFKDRLDGSYNELKANHADRVDVPEENKFIGFDAYQHAIAMADVVILATPPGFRPSHFEEAVRQGKHIFMEKPVAVDGPGVRKVLAAAEEAKKKNLKVAVGLQRHHQKPYIETIKRLHDGAIGDIVAMRAYWNGNTAFGSVRARSWRKSSAGPRRKWNTRCITGIISSGCAAITLSSSTSIIWMSSIGSSRPSVRAWGMGGRQVRKGIDNGEIFDHHAWNTSIPMAAV